MDHKGLAAHFLNAHAAGLTGDKAEGRNAHQRVLIQREKAGFPAGIGRKKAQIHHTVAQPCGHIVVITLPDLHINGGEFFFKAGNNAGQPADTHTVERANAHTALLHAVDLGHLLHGVFVAVQYHFYGRQQRSTAARKLYAAFGARKQRKPEFLFHACHRVADGRGGHVQQLCRTGKAALLRHGVKDLISKQSHNPTVSFFYTQNPDSLNFY